MSTSVTGFCACDPAKTCGSYAAAGALRAETVYSRASDTVIETLEGDRVTLSSSASAAGGFETYEAFSVGMGAAARQYGASTYFESRQELSLSVTGDLNAQELGDINKILRILDKMMKDLSAGDLEGALARSAKFAGIGTIASFSADMRVTANVAVSRYEAVSASMPLPAAEGGNGHADRRIDRAADNFSRGVGANTADMGNLVDTLEKFFSDWFKERSFENEEPITGMKWASRFARRLLDGVMDNRRAEEPNARRAEEPKSRRAEEPRIGRAEDLK